jgi:hypothetical protein
MSCGLFDEKSADVFASGAYYDHVIMSYTLCFISD